MREKDPFDKVLIMPSGKALDAEPRDDAKTRAKSARALVVSELPRDELRREPAPKTLQSGSRTLFDLRRKGRVNADEEPREPSGEFGWQVG